MCCRGEHQCTVSVSRASRLTNWTDLIAAVTILFDGWKFKFFLHQSIRKRCLAAAATNICIFADVFPPDLISRQNRAVEIPEINCNHHNCYRSRLSSTETLKTSWKQLPTRLGTLCLGDPPFLNIPKNHPCFCPPLLPKKHLRPPPTLLGVWNGRLLRRGTRRHAEVQGQPPTVGAWDALVKNPKKRPNFQVPHQKKCHDSKNCTQFH